MKRIILSILFLVMPTLVLAQPHFHRNPHGSATARIHHHHHHRHGGHHWVAPLIIGGIVGAAITHANAQPAPVIVQNGEAVCGHTVPCEVVIPQASPCRAVEVPVRDQSGRILEFRLVCQ
jgi:hypothetical protein